MQPFLQHVAHDIFAKLNGEFSNVTVVFPNKRASLFFNRYLWEKAEGKTMWAPEYTTISELFASFTDHLVGDPVYLIAKLYEVWRDVWKGDTSAQAQRSFDELYPMLEMMLADFGDVDSNLVPADKLFRNTSELHTADDYSFLEEEQRKAIQHFFHDVNLIKTNDTGQTFATLWNRLHDIYTTYRRALLEADDVMVYEGMMKRDVIELTLVNSAEASKAEERLASRLKSDCYVFVGFNVLNRCEMELMRFVKTHSHAMFYWDYDVTFCAGKKQEGRMHRGFEAGTFIEENINMLGSELSHDSAAYNNMRHRVKDIRFVKSPTENAQARYVNAWVNEHVQADKARGNKIALTDYAVVLCNESLLQPTLHSIPNKVATCDGQTDITLNVTMGFPLTDTPVYSLVQALLELQLRGRTPSSTWRYRQVAAVLKHPYVRRMSLGQSSSLLSKLTANNTIFPTDEAFAPYPLLSTIFKHHRGIALTAYLADVLSWASQGLYVSNKHDGADGTTDTNGADDSRSTEYDARRLDFDSQLYKESTFTAYTLINRLHSMQERMSVLSTLSDSTIMRLVYQALSRASVPFHGEPADGMQVMGFLETRNLDFRHVILTSAGEGQMPKASKRPSLIPYVLQVAFGMTTIDKEVSIYAYYFYRLLARAESITILWNSSTEGGMKGEMSRFALQMMVEADNILHHDQNIRLLTFVTPSEAMKATTLSVEKDEAVMNRLRLRFDISTEQTEEWKTRHATDGYQLMLSPSALNCYISCQLKFYFKYVAQLKADDEVSEEMDDATFGQIFHFVMETLYRPYVHSVGNARPLSSSDVTQMANDDEQLYRLIDKGFMIFLFNNSDEEAEKRVSANNIHYSGTQLIRRHVLHTMLKTQLKADARTAEEAESAGGSLNILEVEQKHGDIRTFATDDGTEWSVRLGGIIDRIDLLKNENGETVRVVDYKTSVKPQSLPKKTESLFAPGNKSYHITQTLYYCDVLCAEGLHNTAKRLVVPAVMYFKKNKAGESPVVKNPNKRADIDDYISEISEEFQPGLANTIKSIFEPGTFAATEKDDSCRFCDFRLLCRRIVEKKW